MENRRRRPCPRGRRSRRGVLEVVDEGADDRVGAGGAAARPGHGRRGGRRAERSPRPHWERARSNLQCQCWCEPRSLRHRRAVHRRVKDTEISSSCGRRSGARRRRGQGHGSGPRMSNETAATGARGSEPRRPSQIPIRSRSPSSYPRALGHTPGPRSVFASTPPKIQRPRVGDSRGSPDCRQRGDLDAAGGRGRRELRIGHVVPGRAGSGAVVRGQGRRGGDPRGQLISGSAEPSPLRGP